MPSCWIGCNASAPVNFTVLKQTAAEKAGKGPVRGKDAKTAQAFLDPDEVRLPLPPLHSQQKIRTTGKIGWERTTRETPPLYFLLHPLHHSTSPSSAPLVEMTAGEYKNEGVKGIHTRHDGAAPGRWSGRRSPGGTA